MTVNWQDVITALGGDVALLAAAAWLIKTLVSNRLTMEAEKFKIEIKANADAEIERVKAHLTRTLRVHEHQIDVLTKLHKHFYDALGFFQRMTATGVTVNDKAPQEYLGLICKTMASAYAELSTGRLFITSELSQQCDAFFNKMYDGQSQLDIFYNPMMMASGGEQRAKFWANAQAIAYEDIPKLLNEIAESARAVIHDEQRNPT
jgi:hypothetical protein